MKMKHESPLYYITGVLISRYSDQEGNQLQQQKIFDIHISYLLS
jgi:hypothetical protein